MNKETAYKIFEEMISLAKKEIVEFTLNHKFGIEKKADKTVVTDCDKHIDKVLWDYAKKQWLSVISEEGEKESDIVKSGNYITIDPIDGSLGYIEHVNYAMKNDIKTFLKTDLWSQSDFCLLLWIVIDSKPRYACCYHYVTEEKIMLDSSNKENCIIELDYRKRNYPNACYADQRAWEEIQKNVMKQDDVKTIVQATLWLKSLYTFLNNHDNAIAIHRVQHAGLWDILPAAVASIAFWGILLDDKGEEVIYDKYIVLPWKWATAIKWNRFVYVKEKLKEIPNN